MRTQRRVDNGSLLQYVYQYTFYDGLGQVVQQYADGVVGHVVTNKRYDGRGLLAEASVPHLETGLSGAFAEADWTAKSDPKTVYTYDGLGRQLVVMLPDLETTQTVYENWDELKVDQQSHARRYVKNSLGQLTQVIEYTGTYNPSALQPYATTSYALDVLDRLTGLTDAATIGYDKVGRKYDDLVRLLTASAPPGESYQYSQIGNIASKNGQAYQYGDTNHKHAVTSTPHNGLTYAYDANGCIITRGTQTIKYDPESRPARVQVGGVTVCRFACDADLRSVP